MDRAAAALALKPFSSFSDPIEEVAFTPRLGLFFLSDLALSDLSAAVLERSTRIVILMSFFWEPRDDEAFNSALGSSLTLLLLLAFGGQSFGFLLWEAAQVEDRSRVAGGSKLLFLLRVALDLLASFKI